MSVTTSSDFLLNQSSKKKHSSYRHIHSTLKKKNHFSSILVRLAPERKKPFVTYK